MRTSQRLGLYTLTAVTALVAPAAGRAQEHTGHHPAQPVVVGSLLRDVAQVEEKILALAEALPESAYAWRPSEGVRSVSEVLVHVAADNFFLPTAAGKTAPAATGIKAGDYSSVQAYEKRAMSKAQAMQAVRESFEFLRGSLGEADEAFLGRTLNLFGSEVGGTDLWVMTTTHLHEHLGQLIAYARSNDVVPPWSR